MPKPIYTPQTSKQKKMEPNDPDNNPYHGMNSPWHYDYTENNGKPYSFRVIVDEEMLDAKLKTIKLESKDGVNYVLMVDGNEQGSFKIDHSEDIKEIHFDPTTNKLIFTFKGKDPIEIDLNELKDLYTAGKGIQIDADTKTIEIKLDKETTTNGKNTLDVTDKGLYNGGKADPGTFE